jgi:hypothetical protein
MDDLFYYQVPSNRVIRNNKNLNENIFGVF